MLSTRRLLLGAALALHAVVACVGVTEAVGISDLVWWGADMLAGSGPDAEQRDGAESAAAGAGAAGAAGSSAGPRRTCHCSGPACMCCLDFNMTYIDLGGPGCVRLRYLGQDAGVAMNVSYGDSLLHSEVVKDSSPSQTCMDILSSLAQVCARFSSLEAVTAEAEDQGEQQVGKRGCLQLEPNLLGEVQASYPVGCFRMTPTSMTLEPQSAAPPATTNQPEEGEGTVTPSTGTGPTDLSAESLIAAVSETAEQGIDLLTNWLGLALEEDNNSTTTTDQEATSTAAPEEGEGAAGAAGARRYRQGWVSVD
ncbi:Alpha,alpha-trehalose-phosphate synthase [UDP-forming] 1 [Frankliniella fusca]|uniref:Alpha,alpha-trehalose-phosphate synthase [UDP-forming] 1 n=1 Tax=Frankliniella fusca TaxID=407009 RepID=A0AAE1HUY7_9NEOP|nr:Alpha,alpha-trehalose-phosphate synthase [UDP-forming] 1 [Frankliniella fusca]